LSSYVMSHHHLAVVPQSSEKDLFYNTVCYIGSKPICVA